MAIIKVGKLRELGDEQLTARLFEYQKELNSERGILATGGRTSNPGKIAELKKTIARLLTIQHERKLGIVRTAKAEKAPVRKEEKKPEAKKEEKKEEKK